MCCVARRTHVREARDARGARIVERSLWKAEIVIWSSVLRDRNLELGTAREIRNDMSDIAVMIFMISCGMKSEVYDFIKIIIRNILIS